MDNRQEENIPKDTPARKPVGPVGRADGPDGNHDRETSPDFPDIPEDRMRNVVSALLRTLEMGMAAVYGDEEEGVPDALIDCARWADRCRAECCTYVFALTKEEAATGNIRHDPKRPFFIMREDDGYCSHIDRHSLRCTIWEKRPLRCRRYDCQRATGPS